MSEQIERRFVCPICEQIATVANGYETTYNFQYNLTCKNPTCYVRWFNVAIGKELRK